MVATQRVAFVVFWWLCVVGVSCALAEEKIQFDVPVLVEACEIPSELDSTYERVVEVVIPVSTLISGLDRDAIDEFHFQVHWNRNVYPLVDYGPRTQLQSDINGLIAVEQHQERSNEFGIRATGSVERTVSVNGNAGANQRKSETYRYERIPDQEILIASGTIHRGTGAFFRFHPSKQFALEGGRDLVVAFRVPMNWRGGVLRVACAAQGRRKIFAGITEPISESKTFIVPTYLKGDDQARRIAIEYVQSELQLRRTWSEYRSQLPPKSDDILSKLENAFSRKSREPKLPVQWASELIESGGDGALVHYQRNLPELVRESATEFARSRQSLYQLSR